MNGLPDGRGIHLWPLQRYKQHTRGGVLVVGYFRNGLLNGPYIRHTFDGEKEIGTTIMGK